MEIWDIVKELGVICVEDENRVMDLLVQLEERDRHLCSNLGQERVSELLELNKY